MISDRMQSLPRSELDLIHQASLRLPAENGVTFSDQDTMDIFKKTALK
jgi:Trimethylamine:corrinoid methyltransferase